MPSVLPRWYMQVCFVDTLYCCSMQAVGAYIVTAVVVFLQAYATNKFCQVSIDKAELKTPKCTVLDKDCKFSCELISKVYPSHCTK